MEDAQVRLADLHIARRMEEDERDPRDIKRVTGWEKGGDGKWRFELPDVHFKRFWTADDGQTHESSIGELTGIKGRLGDHVDAPELFEAYPELRDFTLDFTAILSRQTAGEFNPETHTLRINPLRVLDHYAQVNAARNELSGAEADGTLTPARKAELQERIRKHTDAVYAEIDQTLIHEVQHAIQDIEGFAPGGNPGMFETKSAALRRQVAEFRRKADASAKFRRYEELDREFSDIFATGTDADVDAWNAEHQTEYDALHADPEVRDIIDARTAIAKEYGYDLNVLLVLKNPNDAKAWRGIALDDEVSQFSQYRRLAGEVEARNATTRSGMTEEEKRESMLADTADVAPEDMIYLEEALGGESMAFPDQDGSIRQEFGIRNSQLEDGVRLNSVKVGTENFVSTSRNPADVSAHHLRTSDADAELRRRVDAAIDRKADYTVFNKDSQMTAEVSKGNSGEMRHRYKDSSVPGYVYAAAMVNIEPLFQKAKLCLSHDDRYSVNTDGNVDEKTSIQQMHRFFVIMEYEGKKYAVKLTVKEWKAGNNSLYSLQAHETEISEIKKAPADETPTGGAGVPVKTGSPEITFGQIKPLFNLPSNYHSATKITVVSEKARLDAEKKARFLKKSLQRSKNTDGHGPSDAPDGAMEGKRTRTDTDGSDGADGSDAVRFRLAEWSEDDKRDIMKMLRPFVRKNRMALDGQKAAEYLKTQGVDIAPEDAMTFARLELSEIAGDAAKKQWRDAYTYYRSVSPIFDFAMNFAGENFMIRPSDGFLGEDFSGSWISPAWVKYSRKRPQGAKESRASYRRYLEKREAALKNASGMTSDELARAYARETGIDHLPCAWK